MVRKYIDRYVTSIPFEREWYDRMNKSLPRGISISDEINEFLKQRVLELEKEENTPTPDKAPVKFSPNTNVGTVIIKSTQQDTFDVYSSTKEMIKHVNSISDSSKAWNLKRKAKLLDELADTRAKDLSGIVPTKKGSVLVNV